MSDFGKGINVPSKDIVYRQDVEDMLQNALPSRGMWEIEGDVVKNTICETVADLMMDLEKLPSADVQPVVHGEWVGAQAYCDHLNEEAKVNGRPERYLPSGMVIGVYCNQCWCIADKKSDFCPNCGSDNRGEQE